MIPGFHRYLCNAEGFWGFPAVTGTVIDDIAGLLLSLIFWSMERKTSSNQPKV